jgi:hypothetical protein
MKTMNAVDQISTVVEPPPKEIWINPDLKVMDVENTEENILKAT